MVESVLVYTGWVDCVNNLFRSSKGGVEPADVGEVAVPGDAHKQGDGPGVDDGVNFGLALLEGAAFYSHTLPLECKDGTDDCND